MLCSDRVGQVTKTYHDIKAVTHLLEEVSEGSEEYLLPAPSASSEILIKGDSAERAGSGAGSADRSVAPQAEPGPDGSQ